MNDSVPEDGAVPTFVAWKRVPLPEHLITGKAKEILIRESLAAPSDTKPFSIVRARVRDLFPLRPIGDGGHAFSETGPTITKIIARIHELGHYECPYLRIPDIARSLYDQGIGDYVIVVSMPTLDIEGEPHLFVIRRGLDGERWIDTRPTEVEVPLSLESVVIFVFGESAAG